MANYKRKRPRTQPGRGWSTRGNWYTHQPRWFDVVFHTRRRRSMERDCLVRVRQGYDPDDMAWPLDKKPQIYYW